jgi:hypothetical protein
MLNRNTLMLLLVVVVLAITVFPSMKKEIQKKACAKSIATTVAGEWVPDIEGVPRSVETGWADRSPSACENDPMSCSPCSGAPQGICHDTVPHNQGWNNSITGVPGSGMKIDPDGQWRVHKMPNYYGWGSASKYSYGEPFFARSVEY